MEYKRMVSPSLLAADFAALGEAAARAEQEGADSLHLDYMDGHYVPNLTFGIDLIPALRKRVDIPLLAHLMIANTGERLEDFIKAGPDCIILQEDAVSGHEKLIKKIRRAGLKAGLAVNPPRPLAGIRPLLGMIDFLLIMSVNPGFGGQSFIHDTLAKMEEAHDARVKHGYGYDIGVDGGVNLKTAPAIVKTGANVLVAGSAVYGRENVGQAIRDLRGSSQAETGGSR
jgi:ribulose-phosphate 3-epimerase